ncbi:hypothetical protein AHAS_Ahas04G0128500 [Arachis hypogaea]
MEIRDSEFLQGGTMQYQTRDRSSKEQGTRLEPRAGLLPLLGSLRSVLKSSALHPPRYASTGITQTGFL